jgi:putative tricarboxylic transport membrane protein
MANKRTDQIGGLLWIGIGIALCLGSLRLGLGTLNSPEPGLFPFLTGSLLVLVGVILTVSITYQRHRSKGARPETSGIKLTHTGVVTLILLFIYASLLGFLGFILATFLFLFGLFKIMDPRRWVTPLITSALTVTVSYLVFCVWLRINFPKGILGLG